MLKNQNHGGSENAHPESSDADCRTQEETGSYVI